MEQITLLILEKVLEAVYFSLFLVAGKNLKNKRILFISIMIFEYLILTKLIQYNVLLQLSYTFLTYINLKVLYKEKAQITDIFLFAVASIILILVSFISYMIILFTLKQYWIALLLNRVLLFGILWLIRKQINKTYKKFYSLWNKHKLPNKVKSLTLRNISVIVFNLMFWVINIGMIFFLEYLQ